MLNQKLFNLDDEFQIPYIDKTKLTKYEIKLNPLKMSEYDFLINPYKKEK